MKLWKTSATQTRAPWGIAVVFQPEYCNHAPISDARREFPLSWLLDESGEAPRRNVLDCLISLTTNAIRDSTEIPNDQLQAFIDEINDGLLDINLQGHSGILNPRRVVRSWEKWVSKHGELHLVATFANQLPIARRDVAAVSEWEDSSEDEEDTEEKYSSEDDDEGEKPAADEKAAPADTQNTGDLLEAKCKGEDYQGKSGSNKRPPDAHYPNENAKRVQQEKPNERDLGLTNHGAAGSAKTCETEPAPHAGLDSPGRSTGGSAPKGPQEIASAASNDTPRARADVATPVRQQAGHSPTFLTPTNGSYGTPGRVLSRDLSTTTDTSANTPRSPSRRQDKVVQLQQLQLPTFLNSPSRD